MKSTPKTSKRRGSKGKKNLQSHLFRFFPPKDPFVFYPHLASIPHILQQLLTGLMAAALCKALVHLKRGIHKLKPFRKHVVFPGEHPACFFCNLLLKIRQILKGIKKRFIHPFGPQLMAVVSLIFLSIRCQSIPLNLCPSSFRLYAAWLMAKEVLLAFQVLQILKTCRITRSPFLLL